MKSGWWKGLVVPVIVILLAEVAMRVEGSTSLSLAAPSDIAVALLRSIADTSLLAATRDTLIAAGAGLALGGLMGLMLGILFGIASTVDRLMEVSVELIRPIPSVAVLPIAMLVFGFGFRMEIAIVAFSCIWPMMILVRSAMAGIEPRLLEVARALRLSTWQRLYTIVLPAALPRIIVAFRLAAAMALVVAVTVEIAVNPLGLGYGILVAQQGLQPATMLAYLVWTGLLGWAVNALLSVAQHRLLGRAATVGVTR
ncbi:ABC transporter permease subunit [Rhizobium sp. WW_1]|jgi:ABC-type nitrate/sulfonate/bicarbonate transport system permease component|uniref:ABC transporter permease n=1 Tax=Rhizobium sp. WW_1 TaxID=1907375 RepID=UPI00064581A6|nr:ABC transporter permease subunit [Rhizobium sp. WW_1]OJY68535.1 MAG: ABC transporter permease [Rhizobium sp. 60-20]RKD35749.1 NitT/TauT family transport system permease protein [Rhizobium sp. WW_1]